MTVRAAIYCRISLARIGDTVKVDEQELICRKLAIQRGWYVADQHVYKDNAKSAWRPDRKRPGWDAMLQAVERHEIDAIIVYHGDRLIRAPRDIEDLIDLSAK
jgi:DNA invertase Pin-like site-specific DNA recombinase